MITKFKTGLFLIVVFSFSLINAQEKNEVQKENNGAIDRAERMFQHLDINGNDAITLEEFKTKRLKDKSKAAQLEKQFAKMDTDENGSVNRAEFRVFFKENRKPTRIKNKVDERSDKINNNKG